MLKNHLEDFWNAKRFATSWIVNSDDAAKSLEEIKNFAQKIIGNPNLPIDNNPDFYVVQREDTKSVTIEQIRELQNFLYTSSGFGEFKFAVIVEADLMNDFAANCCLKILEEAPRNSFLFLLPNNSSKLLPTIKSRCHKLSVRYENSLNQNASYDELINIILEKNIGKNIKYLKDISTKDKILDWNDFCSNVSRFVINIGKAALGVTKGLTEAEHRYIQMHKNKRINSDKIYQMIGDASKFDLDKRHMGMLILECLS